MHESFQNILLVNLYWLSLPVIGYVGLKLIASHGGHIPVGYLAQAALRQVFLVKIFISLCFCAAGFGLVALLCYLFHLPAIIFTIFFSTVCVGTAAYVVQAIARRLFIRTDLNILNLKGESLLTKMASVALCIALAVDYVLGVCAKGHAVVSADTYVHLSRIVAIISQGFTVESGFFRNIAESGYHVNMIYALYVPPVQLFHLMPAEVWEYSFGFFRLIQWLAIYSLAWLVWQHWLRAKAYALQATALTTLFAIACFGGTAMFIAIYPNQIATVWLVLLVAGLAYYRGTRGSMLPALAASLLIGMTHVAYGLMAAMFVVLVYVLRGALERGDFLKVKDHWYFYGGLTLILLLAPLRTLLYPNHMPASNFNLDKFPVTQLGPLAMKTPPNIFSHAPLSLTLGLFGIIGSAYILYRLWPDKRQLAVALALCLFFPLLVYMPLVFTVLQHIFPAWVINRFDSLNVLRFVTAPVGVYALVQFVKYGAEKYGRVRKVPLEAVQLAVAGTLSIATVLLLLFSYPIMMQYRTLMIRSETSRWWLPIKAIAISWLRCCLLMWWQWRRVIQPRLPIL
jgi:hypothetical protein